MAKGYKLTEQNMQTYDGFQWELGKSVVPSDKMTIEIVLSNTRDPDGTLKRRKFAIQSAYLHRNRMIVKRLGREQQLSIDTSHRNILYCWISQPQRGSNA